MMKDEVSASSFYGDNFMSENTEPVWYKLIKQFKEEKIISDGLTPSFLVGAKNLLVETSVINESSIKSLLDDIVNSSTEDVAVIQACDEVDKGFVIALKDRKDVKKMSIETCFSSSNGIESLCVTKNAAKLGSNIEEISIEMNKLYLTLMEQGKFSWGLPLDDEDYSRKIWREFNPTEKNIILTKIV
jgi:hypothetical protein